MNREPWLVPSAVEYLRLILERIVEEGRTPKVLETGSGGSTLFFMDMGCEVRSFEHSLKWYRRTMEEIVNTEVEGMANPLLPLSMGIDLRYDPVYPMKGLKRKIDDDYDVILIDGRGRVKSIASIIGCQKNGGWLIVDNMERKKYRNEMKNFVNRLHKEWIHFCTKNKRGGDWITTFWKVEKEV